MTYENLLISIVVALITAFVTALLNNYYWRCQLKDMERSEYRKLYHRKKLETYEMLLTKVTETQQVLNEFVFAVTHKTLAKPHILSDKFIDILHFMCEKGIYISRSVNEGLKPLVSKAPEDVAKDPDSFFKEYLQASSMLTFFIAKDLGIPELLHGNEMKTILQNQYRGWLPFKKKEGHEQ